MSDHLLLGQAGGGGLWYLAEDTYGQQGTIGDQQWLNYRTQPYAPVGPQGQTRFKRAYVPIAYSGSCTILVTPIVDFQHTQSPKSESFALPATRALDMVTVPLDVLGTYIALLVQVVAATGRVEIFTPSYAHDPVAPAGATVGP